MTGDGDMEIVDSADHNAASQNDNATNEIGALVEVTFQKNPHQEQKYLEAEPKALGLTQIMLSLFAISISIVASYRNEYIIIPYSITCSLSTLGIIAGSVAIAAQNLHLPKLKACLVMQILTCVAAGVCFIINLVVTVDMGSVYACWQYNYENSTLHQDLCERMLEAHSHLVGLKMLCQAAQVAISATLAAFCCKVIQCCSPRASMPMIVVNAPTAPH
ncbi:uncharacterized protein LOC108440106 isoform X1 [Pygocentrus nattereri]|uniref:uncharacterized protein LOC108440106 isoform X1 n=2 Tax=Pygocentrus nattereri TaxID=42514 RepID=UPI001890EEA9|nr:uncharacterized protein LOC108440106 isoform X1 [Pygocentrus nattereri]